MGDISTLLEVNSDQNQSSNNICLQTINSPKSPSSLQRSVSFTGPKFSLNQNSRENPKKHGNKSKAYLPNVSSDRGISINISNNSVDPQCSPSSQSFASSESIPQLKINKFTNMSGLALKRADNMNKGGLFGGGAEQRAPTGGGGLFGGGGAPQAPAAGGGGLFGQPQKPNSQTITSMFAAAAGQQPQQQAPAQGGGLFGGAAPVQQAQIQGGLFGGAKPAATPGGLFGGASTNQPPAGGGLFGAPAQTQPAGAGGLFGGGAPAQPTQGAGGLFGAPAQAAQQPGAGLFGGAQAKPAAGVGMFGQQQPAAGGGLFGVPAQAKPAGAGLFGLPQPNPAALQQPNQNPFGVPNNMQGQNPNYLQQLQTHQNMIKNFQSPEFIALRKQQDQQKQQKEIQGLFGNYEKNIGLQVDSESNQFTQTFYNHYGEQTPKDHIDFHKKNIPKYFQVTKKERVPILGGLGQPQQQPFGAAPQPQQQQTQVQEVIKNVHVNLNQWLQSYSKNPDSNKFYTVQLNSTQELLTRAEGVCGKIQDKKVENEIKGDEPPNQETAIAKLEKKLKDVKTRMRSRQQEQNESMMNGLEITKVKNQQILSQLIRIYGKFERLINVEGRAQLCNAADRDSLQNAQNKLLKKINDPNRQNGGLMVKVEDVQSIIRYTEAIDEEVYQSKIGHETEDSTERGQDITDDDLQDMFNVLKKQKRGIDILTESINESTRQLMVMEREIELGCGHRRLAARQAQDF